MMANITRYDGKRHRECPHPSFRFAIASVEQSTALPSLGDRATFSGSSKARSFAPKGRGEEGVCPERAEEHRRGYNPR